MLSMMPDSLLVDREHTSDLLESPRIRESVGFLESQAHSNSCLPCGLTPLQEIFGMHEGLQLGDCLFHWNRR
jgi:hypothetical protein